MWWKSSEILTRLFLSELQRTKSTIRCHQVHLLLCLPPASCVHLILMTPSSVWRTCLGLHCEWSYCALLQLYTVLVRHCISKIIIILIDCFAQLCGDPDHWAVQALQRKDAKYPGAGTRGGHGCQSTQTQKTSHGERMLQRKSRTNATPNSVCLTASVRVMFCIKTDPAKEKSKLSQKHILELSFLGFSDCSKLEMRCLWSSTASHTAWNLVSYFL